MHPNNSPIRRRTILLRATVRSAFKSLRVNRTRSLLTMLGVIVGVAAVMTAVTLTQGASLLVTARIANLGSNVLFVSSATGNASGRRRLGLGGGGLLSGATAASSALTLTQEDADAIGKIAHASAVTPLLTLSQRVVHDAAESVATVEGVYPVELEIGSWSVAHGRWLTTHDENAAQASVVLGATSAADLFGNASSAINKSVLINGQAFLVVGVLQPKGGNQDGVVFMPFSTMQTRLDHAQFVNAIDVKVDSSGNIDTTQQAITSLLQARHHIAAGQPADFQITSSTQIASVVDQTTSTLTILLVSVAAISLLVGGIGIMNIMLVSVTERTREIGIRMAIGARSSAIRDQFLIEAAFLSGTGGLLGILIGLLGGWGLTLLFALPFGVSFGWIAVAVLVAGLVGVVFGYYPAARASRLDPIVALRME